MRHLVIGHGEIGRALCELLGADWIDLSEQSVSAETYGHLHIAVPFTERFAAVVDEHREKWKPDVTVVHSTVPVGTCENLRAVHSPCRGVHPNLLDGIRTFTKFFGGPGANIAAEPFRVRGVPVEIVSSSRDTEAMKLWETTQYGVYLRTMQEIYGYCRERGLDFDTVYTRANETYNEGYSRLGMPYYCRPVLRFMGDGIGGHCVMPNARLLDSALCDLVLNEGR